MPNGRFLAKSIANDWKLNSVSLAADYLFSRCVPHLDVDGRMPGSPEEVKGTAVPLRHEMGVDLVEQCLLELSGAGLVSWYTVDGRPCLEFPGFSKNQKGLRKNREAPSRIPSPKVDAAQPITESLRTYSGSTPDLLRINSGSTPDLLPPKFKFKSKNNPPKVPPSYDSDDEGDVDEKQDGLFPRPPTPAEAAVGRFLDAAGCEWPLKEPLSGWTARLVARDEFKAIDVAWEIEKAADWWETAIKRGQRKPPKAPTSAIINWLNSAVTKVREITESPARQGNESRKGIGLDGLRTMLSA